MYRQEHFPNISSSVLISYLKVNSVASTSEKCIAEGSKYAHWIGLYLSFHLSWVLGPLFHGRPQKMKTTEDNFCHAITPSNVQLGNQYRSVTGETGQ